MIEIPGYSITEIIYHDPYIMVGYALSEKTSKIVLLKVVINGNRTMIENAKLIHEYNLLSKIEMEGILKPVSYNTFKNKIILEYEPIHGNTLRGYFANGSVSVAMYASILMRVVQRLHQLHEHNILHLNIRPDTLLIHPNTNQIFLTGFGYAVQFKQQKFQGKGQLEGNPVYMSPEQTGRFNQAVDIRADIYSLGITFYELFAQKLPFQATGALEWAHSHLAHTPIPLHVVNQKIPQQLSAIIMRMLAKDPDARYENLHAIQKEIALYLSGKSEDSLGVPEYTGSSLAASVSMRSNAAAQQLFALNVHSSLVGGEYHNYFKELGEQQPANKLSLTKREREVLQLMSKGLSNGEIAEELTITKETVKTHVKHIFEKLKVDRRMKAVAVAKTLGILEE